MRGGGIGHLSAPELRGRVDAEIRKVDVEKTERAYDLRLDRLCECWFVGH